MQPIVENLSEMKLMRKSISVLFIAIVCTVLASQFGCQPMPIPPTGQWKSATLMDGNFQMKFPYEPKMESGSNGKDSLSSNYRNEIGFTAIAYNLGIDDPKLANVAEILDGSVTAAAGNSKCEVLENKPIVISDLIECRDALFAGDTGDLFRTRIYFSRTTGNLYQASVFGASKEIVYGANAKTFFDSIQLEE
jgi:hypothetical protein